MKSTIVWFNQDRRVEDNLALNAAIHRNLPVIPLFIWDPKTEGEWKAGSSCQWWIQHSLENLKSNLQLLGLTLIIRQGDYCVEIERIVKETLADAVYWNQRYEPEALNYQAQVKSKLSALSVKTQSFNSTLLFEPWAIANSQQKPFQVFTPFWKKCLSLDPPVKPVSRPKTAIKFPKVIATLQINDLKLKQAPHLLKFWKPGEDQALKILSSLDQKIEAYDQARDYPSQEGTSKLSPYLHHGEISPRQIWHVLLKTSLQQAHPFLRQLGLRDFANYILYHFPKTPKKPLKDKFSDFPWKVNAEYLERWKEGRTGYPIIDAGMKELLNTGWMHNRVRMIVGSFLVKNLLIHWLEGARWFWENLVDADLANNTFGWQWVAGCGADAAPYFRIFNPISQGEKFDADGKYVSRWLPELSQLPKKWIQKPFLAPIEILQMSNLKMDKTYPLPIVDHSETRKQALQIFHKMAKEDFS